MSYEEIEFQLLDKADHSLLMAMKLANQLPEQAYQYARLEARLQEQTGVDLKLTHLRDQRCALQLGDHCLKANISHHSNISNYRLRLFLVNGHPTTILDDTAQESWEQIDRLHLLNQAIRQLI